MEIFLSVLQGAYAYLLIFQILVVSLLLLALLWLIVHRTREAAEQAMTTEGANAGTTVGVSGNPTFTANVTANAIDGQAPPIASPSVSPNTNTTINYAANAAYAANATGSTVGAPTGSSSASATSNRHPISDDGFDSIPANSRAGGGGADLTQVTQLKERIATLQAENDNVKQVEESNRALLDKVNYLESKLLEYEILQEEIGALSALKVENEELRQKISDIEGTAPAVTTSESTVIAAPTVTAAPEIEASISAPAPAAPATEKTEFVAQNDVPLEPSVGALLDVAAMFDVDGPKAPKNAEALTEAPPEPKLPELKMGLPPSTPAKPVDAEPDLSSLLDQIDKLTQPPSKNA